MSQGPEGVRAALDAAMEGQAGMEGIVQAGLFEELEEHDTGSLTAASPLSAALPTRGRRGRPVGSKNRRTEAVTSWLLAQHRHPLSVLMEAYSMATATLAEKLGLRREMITETVTTTTMVDGREAVVEVKTFKEGQHFSNDVLIELLKLQLRMAEAVLPYVAQKMTAGGEGAGGAALSLTFAQLNLGGAGGGEGVSVPAPGGASGFLEGLGMPVKLGQVGQD